MSFPQQLLLVGAGGFMGAVARWMLTDRLNAQPWDILAINVFGSFLIGIVLGFQQEGVWESVRLILATGFCGGFTTFSAFSYQTLQLLKDGRLPAAGLNVALSLVVCILAAWIGVLLAEKFS